MHELLIPAAGIAMPLKGTWKFKKRKEDNITNKCDYTNNEKDIENMSRK